MGEWTRKPDLDRDGMRAWVNQTGFVWYQNDPAKRVAKLEAALRAIAEFTADAPEDDPLSHVHGAAVEALEQ